MAVKKKVDATKRVVPIDLKCQEAHPASREDYIPCGRPATCIVHYPERKNEKALSMCDPCGHHNVKNRGARYVMESEPYTLAKIAAPTPEAIARNLGPAPTSDGKPRPNTVEIDDDVEAAPTATDDQLKRVSTLAQQQLKLLDEIAALEEQLSRKNIAYKVNLEKDLPEAMSQCGMLDFTLSNGASVEIKKVVRAAIPAAHKDKGIEYMLKAAPDLVKHKIEIEFGMKDSKFFNKFLRDLKQRKTPVNAKITDSVHGSTLSKYVRECDEESKPVPEDILGVFRSTTAEVKRPKMGKDEV